jgi:hypothetical protein
MSRLLTRHGMYVLGTALLSDRLSVRMEMPYERIVGLWDHGFVIIANGLIAY